MRISVQTTTKKPMTKGLVVAYHKGAKPNQATGWKKISGANRKMISAHFNNGFKGMPTQDQAWLTGRGKEAIVLLGLGEKKRWTQHTLVIKVRKLVQLAKQQHINDLTLWLDDLAMSKENNEQQLVETISTQAIIADYEFNDYKKKPKEGWPTVQHLALITSGDNLKKLSEATKVGSILGQETNKARRLANTPGSDMTPNSLALAARAVAKENKLSIEVLKPAQIKKLGMGGVLGVARGSDEEPRFIILEYRGSIKKSDKPIVLVGKGVTFDTGGLNLKPEDSMYEMHLDMAGAASVIHAIAAVAQLKLNLNVIALVPAVENMPSGSGYRPGDLLRSMSGKTIEVMNTDAEGRIILADALTYAERYKPQLVVDLATLTGAALVALGSWPSALFTKEEQYEPLFRQSGEATGDYVWPLPLWDEYDDEVAGTFGDVANIGKLRGRGGAIIAAAFLRQFTKKYPWVHIDIAPTMTSIEGQYLGKGATGAGMRVVVEVLRRLSA